LDKRLPEQGPIKVLLILQNAFFETIDVGDDLPTLLRMRLEMLVALVDKIDDERDVWT
jgi:hypothetical protein